LPRALLDTKGNNWSDPKTGKMRKGNHTAIKQFEVIKPRNSYESKGEILDLSFFGEYCPPRSARGYQLGELLKYPKNYRPVKVIEKGVVRTLNYKSEFFIYE
jgi:hypothetical protein